MSASQRQRITLTLTILILGVVLAACGGGGSGSGNGSGSPEPSDSTLIPGMATAVPADPTPALAAMVNNQAISLEDFQRKLAYVESSRSAMGQAIPGDRADFEAEVLDTMIEAVLIEQAAANVGITLSETELDGAMARNIEEAGGSEAWNEWLTMSYLTPDEYRRQLRTQIIGGLMTTHLTSDISDVAEQVHARHILVDLESTANEVLNQLSEGADFAALAQQYSIDNSTRASGGDLDWFARGQLLEAKVEETAFALAPGAFSDIITSSLGYHIVQALEYEPARTLSDEARNTIILMTIEHWRQGLWEDAEITRFIGTGS